jgi:hypothetical protein
MRLQLKGKEKDILIDYSLAHPKLSRSGLIAELRYTLRLKPHTKNCSCDLCYSISNVYDLEKLLEYLESIEEKERRKKRR